MKEPLNVWYRNQLVGQLQATSLNAVQFSYVQTWLDYALAFPISLSLPLQEKAFSPKLSSNFFDNLLPEGPVREKLCAKDRLESTDIFGLLKKHGAECAGALSILKADEEPKEYTYAHIENKDYESLLMSANLPLLTANPESRLSLAGAQNKIALKVENGQFYLPLHNAPSTHILKPYSTSYKHLPENEYFCMNLAALLGLAIPYTELTLALNRALLIKRYDRDYIDEQIVRLHQEDFCQALGISRHKKYQSPEGANLKKCFTILDNCQNPQEDKIKLFTWVIYNILIGNADSHAKNISLLYTAEFKKPILAPFYDLLSTEICGFEPKLAMKIGNALYLPNENPAWQPKINGFDLEKLASLAELSFAQAKEIILALCAKAETNSLQYFQEFSQMYGQVNEVTKLVLLINKNSQHLKNLIK